MNRLLRVRTKGQTIAIVGLLVATGVLIGLVALAFDGGSALLQRRAMQNAAEAGAVAGIQMMGSPGSVLGSCDTPPGCRPVYMVTESALLNRVNTLVNDNRGGTIGTATYSTTVEYHYMISATVGADYAPCADCYGPAPRPNNPNAPFVPDYVDGIRVTARVSNPTVFARAFFPSSNPNGIGQIDVSAKAAGRVYPTCAPPEGVGVTLPFTRFRPAFEQERLTARNDPQHPFVFWTSNPDINGDWKQTLSFREKSCFPSCTPTNTNQLLTAFDLRYGRPPSGVGPNYERLPLPPDCTPASPDDTNCADMRGIGDMVTDHRNWMYWQWSGTISITNTHLSPSRPGDWAETYQPGTLGNNLGEAIRDMIDKWGVLTDLSGPPGCTLGPPDCLGKAVDRTMYLYGPSLSQFAGNGDEDTTTAQTWNGTGWQDVRIYVQGNHYTSDAPVYRVRVTDAVKMRFYAGLQETNSEVRGLYLSQAVIGPQAGNCGWSPGNGVYSRQVGP